MSGFAFRSWDADNHYYEARDCFTRHLDPTYADRAVQAVTLSGGEHAIVVDGRPFTFLADSFRDTVAKPGALREMLRTMSSGSPTESSAIEPMQPAYVDREARLELSPRAGASKRRA
jgi:hypothetical protein